MWFFYVFALVPLIFGLLIWVFNKKITWTEWLGGSATAFILAAIMHGLAIYGQTDDIETWSGQVISVTHCPQWVEQWQEAIYRTETYHTGTGKNRQRHTRRVFSHYETRHDTHPEYWDATLYFGEISETKGISQKLFNEIKNNFGSTVIDGGIQLRHHGGKFDGGDNNIYITPNKTGYLHPVTTIRHFENRIKATPTVFSFAKVPTNCPVYLWPENPNWNASDRLLNEYRINPLEFDRMNSRLGSKKFINVIMINFNNQDASIANWQQAAWVGGKKNDLVLCYGQLNTNGIATWSKCFGWTESEQVKRNLETILLEHSVNNDILEYIEKEIIQNYNIKDWSKFDYVSIEPPLWSYIVYLIVLVISQIGLWIWFHINEFQKE